LLYRGLFLNSPVPSEELPPLQRNDENDIGAD
jgi:hypothetical protein